MINAKIAIDYLSNTYFLNDIESIDLLMYPFSANVIGKLHLFLFCPLSAFKLLRGT